MYAIMFVRPNKINMSELSLQTPQSQEDDPAVKPRHATIDTTVGSLATNSFIVGAQRLPDGTLDLSSSAYLLDTPEVAKALTPLESMVQKAESAGVTEQTLRQISQILRVQNKPIDRDLTLSVMISKNNLPTNSGELLTLVRAYQKELIRSTEKGALYHYHQTDIANLASILDSGGLLSFDEQKRLGKAPKSTGTRPDVVQMTRDVYDAEGNLVRPGLAGSSAGIGSSGGNLVFVLDESIMDGSDYDGCSEYPNIPAVPLTAMRAILVNDINELPNVRQACSDRGISVDVIPRSEWLDQYKRQEK